MQIQCRIFSIPPPPLETPVVKVQALLQSCNVAFLSLVTDADRGTRWVINDVHVTVERQLCTDPGGSAHL